MAKKQTKKVEVEEPYVEETVVVEAPKPESKSKPAVKKKSSPEDDWEIKDRMYYLTGNKSPLTYLMRGSNVFYFDEEKGYERELKYCSNQRTCFVDEMQGEQRLEHIIFRTGSLMVPKNKTVLQHRPEVKNGVSTAPARADRGSGPSGNHKKQNKKRDLRTITLRMSLFHRRLSKSDTEREPFERLLDHF